MRDDFASFQTRGLDLKIREAFEEYEFSLNERSESTKEWVHKRLRRFVAWCDAEGYLEKKLRRLATWARLDGVQVSAHIWRHTYAMNYLKNGGDVYKLSRLMGHTGIAITENWACLIFPEARKLEITSSVVHRQLDSDK